MEEWVLSNWEAYPPLTTNQLEENKTRQNFWEKIKKLVS